MLDASFTSELRWLLSGVFVVVGAGVFYLASLLSGHNIYRDLKFEVAMLATTIVGLLLFAFSPISYIVFIPTAYIDGYAAAVEAFEYSRSREDAILLINTIHDVTLKFPCGVLYSYVLAAVGSGMIFGCAQVIRPRELILMAVRDFANVAFSIYSYRFTWDEFLHTIKRDGLIKITLRTTDNQGTAQHGSEMQGHLAAFSVKDEPKEIMLTMSGDSRVLVTRAEDILRLEVPKQSFKRDRLSAAPTSYALYSLVLLLGLAFVFFSASSTARFVHERGFVNLSLPYWLLGLAIFIAYAFGCCVFVPQLLRRDFSKLRSALLLRPFFFYFFSLHLFLLIAACWYLVDTGFFILRDCGLPDCRLIPDRDDLLRCIFGVLFLGCCAWFIVRQRELTRLKKRLSQAIEKLMERRSKRPRLAALQAIAMCLESIYQEQDLNEHRSGYLNDLTDELILKSGENADIYEELRKEIGSITRTGKEFGHLLGNDQFAVVSTLRFLTGRRIAREIRRQCS